MGDEECDIFKFTGSSSVKKATKLLKSGSLGSTLKKSTTSVRGSLKRTNLASDSSSSTSSCSDEDDHDGGGKRRRYSRKKRPLSKRSMAVSRLLNIKNPRQDSNDVEGEVETSPSTGNPADRDRSPSVSVLSTPSNSSPSSPRPSPPPPGLTAVNCTPGEAASFKVLSQANDVLNRLLYSPPCTGPGPNVIQEVVEISPKLSSAISAHEKINLRVRCKGKVRKYSMEKTSPFSEVISLLSKDLRLTSEQNLLLSHKTATLMPTESPLSRSLTTADIIDAVVIQKADFPEQERTMIQDLNAAGESSAGRITVKVQTDSKQKAYKISVDDPLYKVMSAFSSELGVSTSKLKFLFDGDSIQPNQSAKDIDMEENDCIDVVVL